MTRYFFDIREDDRVVTDVDGAELADLRAAEIEAAQTIAELARELVPETLEKVITIAVRDAAGVCLSLELKFTMLRR